MRRRVIHAPAMDPATLLQVGILILAFVVAIGIGLLIIEKIRKSLVKDDADWTDDPLSTFRKSFEKGEMDEAEFRRITASLSGPGREFSPPEKPARPKDFPLPRATRMGVLAR